MSAESPHVPGDRWLDDRDPLSRQWDAFRPLRRLSAAGPDPIVAAMQRLRTLQIASVALWSVAGCQGSPGADTDSDTGGATDSDTDDATDSDAPEAAPVALDDVFHPLAPDDAAWAEFAAWNDRFNAVMAARDEAAVADLHEEGAVMFLPPAFAAPPLVGRAAIVANNYAPLFAADGHIEHTLVDVRVGAAGNVALVSGAFMAGRTVDGAEEAFAGTYTLVLSRLEPDEPWRIFGDTFFPEAAPDAGTGGLDRSHAPLTAGDAAWPDFVAWNNAYNQALAGRSEAAVGALYEDGAILFPPTFLSPAPLVGRAAILAGNYAPLFAADGTVTHTVDDVRLGAGGVTALVTGRFDTVQTVDGVAQQFTGGYSMVLSKVTADGPWRALSDTFVPTAP